MTIGPVPTQHNTVVHLSDATVLALVAAGGAAALNGMFAPFLITLLAVGIFMVAYSAPSILVILRSRAG